MTEIPAKTPRPIGSTDSFLPGSVNCGAADDSVDATAVPEPAGMVLAAAVVAVLPVSGTGTEPATSVVAGVGSAVPVG